MQSFSDVLNLVKDYFLEKVRSNELTETAYRCWIKNIEPDRFENNTAYLLVSSPFYRGILIDQYMTQLKEAFEAVLGKTHLLMAIKNELQQKAPQLNVIYTSCETFVNELIIAIKKQNTDEFHTKYRSLADFFLIDDIQFLSGKESSQEEFFHTFNELYQGGKQIVITSDRPPKDINILEDRLKTRFEWGLLADIGAPDFETRVAIIQRKAELLHIELPDDIINFIATKLKTNIRQLEGAVNKIKMHKLYTGSEPSLSIAQTVINEILNDNQPMPITIERIIDEVAQTYRVNPADIRSNKKNAPISQARQIAIYIVREITQATMKEIGQEFGGRDHTTIVYTLKKVENLIKTNAHDRGIIEDIIKNIRDK